MLSTAEEETGRNNLSNMLSEKEEECMETEEATVGCEYILKSYAVVLVFALFS